MDNASCWYDASDIRTLWQDAAGKVPVRGIGDPVARIDDKLGNYGPMLVDGEATLQRDDSGYPYVAFKRDVVV